MIGRIERETKKRCLGLSDSTINKTFYTMHDFKEKLKYYETMHKRCFKQKIDNKVGAKVETAVVCYNCGVKGHKYKNCKDKEKGINCNKFGHISKECPLKVDKSNVRQLAVENVMNVNVKFVNQCWMTLIDTGSKFNVVTEKVHISLNNLLLSILTFISMVLTINLVTEL